MSSSVVILADISRFIDSHVLKKYFFGVPHSATFIFVIFGVFYVIASITYIHAVYGAGVRTHDLLIMSPLPLPLDHGSRQLSTVMITYRSIQSLNCQNIDQTVEKYIDS
jgi:hypothetical protein